MRKLLVFICISAFMAGAAFAQSTTSSYQEKLGTMMKMQGSEETYKVVISQMLGQFQTMNAEVPAEVWAEMENEFMKASLDELVALLVPVYQKHLTEADLDGIIDFYNSEVGKKLASATPAITQESMVVGQTWGMKIGQIVADKLAEKGY